MSSKFPEVNDFYAAVGKRIKERREELKLTQKELGSRIQADQSAIKNYERGRYKIATHILVNLAKALELPNVIPLLE